MIFYVCDLHAVGSECDVLHSIINLQCFLNPQQQDYGLSLAEKGELLDYIRRVS